MPKCQCEHAAHFPDDWEVQVTPNGNPGHKYGVAFLPAAIRTVQTTYGAFNVCRDCAADCHGEG
jgi:hypothetical protein